MSRPVQDVRELFAAKGIRTTAQRLAVYQYLVEHPIHPTAATIFAGLNSRYPTMSRATVYNALEVLTRKGLVQQLDLGEGVNRYDGNPDFHVHVICRACGQVEDVEGDGALTDLERRVAQRLGFSVEERRFELFGLCRRCAAAKRPR